ncbi:hypothetical protein KF840_22830 [bacterium]|nr:hypothetical protein [bacterium]
MTTHSLAARSRAAALALATLAVVMAGRPLRAQDCAGDCAATGAVGVSDILRCVAIDLGRSPLAACDACDVDGDTRVSVDELVAAVAAALGGCPAPPVASAVARFTVPEAGALDWGDVPFPSDLYRDDAGAIRIGALPISAAETPLQRAMRDLLQGRDGFCATCNAYFVIEGAIDPASLPADDSPGAADAALLVDVDPGSPERGRLIALRLEWNGERHLLALRPNPGIALHRNRRYAAVLTTALRAADGRPVGASPTFAAAKRRHTSSSAPAIERARTVVAAALDELERIGIGRNRIVALAPYTTEDVTADVLGTRAAVQGGAPLPVTIDRWRRGEEIDELLGIPGEDRPGIDVPPAEGVAGTRAIAHDAIGDVITGVFLAPRVVTGSGTEIGTARRDASGAVVAGPRQPVPFVLTLPRAPAAPAVPLLVAHHGFSASRVTGFASANTAARAGFAVLAIDAYQHGDRAASATDTLHAMRGNVPGPDGFAETVALDVTGRVFGVLGAAPGLESFTGYSLGAFLQFEADIVAAVRIARDGELLAALRDAGVASLAGFDPRRIGFIGNSLGAVVGAAVLAAEPDVGFGIQNVPPGSIVETLAESPEFRPLVDSLFLPLLGVVGPFDEVDRHLLFDPLVDLTRWILEPIDPLALAPYLLADPVRAGGAPEILFQVAALDEVAAPRPTAAMLAATGTTRATRYDPAAHGMLEVLAQSSRYVPPAAPPFVLRPMEIAVLNPLVAEHDEIEAFLIEQTQSE